MNVAEITAKAKVLLEALPYIQDFRGSTFVVKYGAVSWMIPIRWRARASPTTLLSSSACGINVVVVHGGGKAITKAMEQSGLKATFVNGMRVTDEATVADREEDARRDRQQGRLRRDHHCERQAQGSARRHGAGLPETHRR